ncbi:hypothetical protein L1987_03554 [Smallanthus sonchifolius]|uniref:Uncharacterized protein n=1 Tax=Smallanthus sonchifolius TaxID=185202 RepID=A0ACB9KB71_9ASTR|nr:hypothetical protein L1987_03554 [Smallanthus sonchifolius]
MNIIIYTYCSRGLASFSGKEEEEEVEHPTNDEEEVDENNDEDDDDHDDGGDGDNSGVDDNADGNSGDEAGNESNDDGNTGGDVGGEAGSEGEAGGDGDVGGKVGSGGETSGDGDDGGDSSGGGDSKVEWIESDDDESASKANSKEPPTEFEKDGTDEKIEYETVDGKKVENDFSLNRSKWFEPLPPVPEPLVQKIGVKKTEDTSKIISWMYNSVKELFTVKHRDSVILSHNLITKSSSSETIDPTLLPPILHKSSIPSPQIFMFPSSSDNCSITIKASIKSIGQ